MTILERAKRLLETIAERDRELNCYVAIDREAVLRDAARLDDLPVDERGALHGFTLAVKDIIDVAGLPTRAGSSFFRRDPYTDAPVVARLRAAGALVIGKTNTHEFAWGITTENPHFGRTGNPRDAARTPGGSSGGSAAAVGGGLADIALGSDTLGSMRIPAALCGIVGFRPATGALPVDGIFPLAPSFDVPGPFARDAAGVARVYGALTGAPVDPVQLPERVARARGGGWEAIGDDMRRAIDETSERLRAAGVRVEDVAWWEEPLIEAVATVQMYEAARIHERLIAEHRGGYGDDVRKRVERSLTLEEVDVRQARAAIEEARLRWRAAFGDFPVVLAPVVAGEAPRSPVPASFRAETIPLVSAASAFGLPALAIPAGTGTLGLPLGVQLIGTMDPAPVFALGEVLASEDRDRSPG